ncbi:hypothetical protein NC653_010019 [Populus alba x Populus x berolinensis]|uniref:Uncharacterized protein n=1 Tax=Populus alba x Populus x berolinensis TaxID=444605 RepID=A0AAD6RAY2_9ROSI|nr:hypothetical protein NC653_010019 [Populus alba x Populus x berolinensis]
MARFANIPERVFGASSRTFWIKTGCLINENKPKPRVEDPRNKPDSKCWFDQGAKQITLEGWWIFMLIFRAISPGQWKLHSEGEIQAGYSKSNGKANSKRIRSGKMLPWVIVALRRRHELLKEEERVIANPRQDLPQPMLMYVITLHYTVLPIFLMTVPSITATEKQTRSNLI